MAVQIYLEMYSGDMVSEVKEFDRETIKIGRLSSAHVRLEDTKVARIHAIIEAGATADSVSIQDLGSTSGTIVNGNKVNKAKLASGDTILLGDTKMVIYIGSRPSAQAAVQPAPAMQQVAPAPFQPAVAQPMAQVSPMAPMAPMAQVAPAQTAAAPLARGGAEGTLRFDSGEQPDNGNDLTQQRISTSRLGKAAIEQKAHPALPPEDRMTPDNMNLEMRVYWGQILLDIRHYNKVPKISIGEAKGHVDIFVTAEQLPNQANYPLIRYMDEQYILTFHNCMEGEFDFGDGISRKLEELKKSTKAKKDDALDDSYQLTLTPETKGIIHYAGMTFAFRFVSPPKALKSSPFSGLDVNFINLISMSFCLHLAFIIMAYVYPFDIQDLKENLFTEPDRFAALIVAPPQENKSAEDLLKKMQEKAQKEQEELKKKKEEKKEEKPKEKVVTKTVTKQEKQQKNQANVKKALDQLFSSDDDGGSLLGGGGGGSLSGALSNVIGTMGSGSASAGLAGLGIRGSGPMTGGGVGTSRGIGGIGLLGGGGKGANYNVGIKKKVEVKVEFNTEPTITGGLTKADIKKVIHKNRNQIRYCYEQGLATNKNLEGRVAIQWIINGQGNVVMATVSQSDMAVKSVEQCIIAKIKTWKFPEPKGGGIVEVNYPFTFKTS